MDETLYAARDPHGYRPLVLGRLASGWVVASGDGCLDLCGATVVRDRARADFHRCLAHCVASPCAAPTLAPCCVPGPPRSTIGNVASSPRATRWGPPRRENPIEADLVMPTPDSKFAAIGYAQEAGIPFSRRAS